MSKKIILTGGGTAGHVMPNLALARLLKERGWQVEYIGSNGIERQLVSLHGILFHVIAAGKLRRYFSWQNFMDILKVIWGSVQSFKLLLKIKPQVIFTKGGYVSVPVAVAGWMLRIPVLTHESDITPGLANKLMIPLSKRILFAFQQTQKFLPLVKSRYVGLPVRKDIQNGEKSKGLALCNFRQDDSRPILIIMGGSQGAKTINEAILAALSELTKEFRIIHLTGKGKSNLSEMPGSYKSFEFVGDELAHLLACTDFALCRAGANTIFELLHLRIPMLLVPLQIGSRGDQILNARAFVEQGWAYMLREDELTANSLILALQGLKGNKDSMINSMKLEQMIDSCEVIMEEIDSVISQY